MSSIEFVAPPSGSYRRLQWRVLAATMFCYLFYYTGRQSFGFAIPGIQAELGLGKRELGFVSTALLWSYALGQAVNGNLADKFGGRRMVGFGAMLSCGLNWLVSFAQGLPGLMVPWGLNGFAQSMGWAPGSRVLSNWWPHRERGRAYGFYVFAAGLSSVLTYALATAVLEAGLGWRWIFRLPVLLMILGGAVYYWLVRDRPADCGFAADEHDMRPSVASRQDAPTVIERSRDRYRAVLGNFRFLAACLSIGFQSLARYGLLIWVPVYFLGADWKESGGGRWINLSLPIGMAFGALVSGKLSDKYFDRRRWALITLFLTAAAVVSLGMYSLPHGHPAGIVLLFLCGFFAYGPQSAYWALCPDLLGVSRSGTGTGVMNTFAYLFAGLGEPLIGHILETRPEGALLVFPIVAASCIAGAVVAPLIRR
jgi:OPA family glycerol-3-phosphate transporter-like MFS transporter